jgi:hypothetical protein
MTDTPAILDFLCRHLESIFAGDWQTYQATTSPELTLYEHFVTPHRQEGLEFHKFMIENRWATAGKPHHFSILEPKVQLLAGEQVAVVCYTLMLSTVEPEGLKHRSHNETRVLERVGHVENGAGETWQVVHVHKSPSS